MDGVRMRQDWPEWLSRWVIGMREVRTLFCQLLFIFKIFHNKEKFRVSLC